MFKEAKKDKNAKQLYAELTTLKENFDKLITNIQEQNKLRNQIREVEVKIEDFRIKYKNGDDIKKLEEDLNAVKRENENLGRQVGA